MNKSQNLAVMQVRAKIKIQELLEQHDQAWNGQEPVVIIDNKEKESEEKDGSV